MAWEKIAKFKTANIFVGGSMAKIAKLNARQYFRVYGMCVYSNLIERVHTFGEFNDIICYFDILYKEAVL